ncbi:hypothetical protein [Haloferula sp. BvORR071]|uniref:hypothetical protein n=1 Tax=Haloferula sp. BvORR071 TaxID=1396141 RepID=UPI000552DAB9|nr:hypothetical protein [Haloferula sp. BvORR071]
MFPIALFFGFALFFMNTEIVAMHGSFVQRLDLPGASIVPWLPAIATAVFALAVFGLRRVRTGLFRVAGFILALSLCNMLPLYTVELFKRATVPIRLTARPNQESRAKLDAAYPMRRAFPPSSSAKGVVMLVRREDYSKAMAQFATELVLHQGSEYP